HSYVHSRTSFAHRIRSGTELEHRTGAKDASVARLGRADNKVVDVLVRVLAAVDRSPISYAVAGSRRRTLPFSTIGCDTVTNEIDNVRIERRTRSDERGRIVDQRHLARASVHRDVSGRIRRRKINSSTLTLRLLHEIILVRGKREVRKI